MSTPDTRTSDVEQIAKEFIDRNGKFICVCDVGVEECPRATKIEEEMIATLTSFREKVVAEERERIALDVKHRLALCGHACGATQELSELLQALTPSKV